MSNFGSILLGTGAFNPLISCTKCSEFKALADASAARLQKIQADLRVSEGKLAQQAVALAAANGQITGLQVTLAQPRDVTVKALREEVERLGKELAALRTPAGALATTKASAKPPGAVPLRHCAHHRAIEEVGYAEVAFAQFAAMRDMTPVLTGTWIINGRVSARFFSTCLQAVMPVPQIRHLMKAPQGTDHGGFFFWLNEALGLTVDLLVLVDAAQATGPSSKTHQTKFQLQMAITKYNNLRLLYHNSLVDGYKNYLEKHRPPTEMEWGRTIPIKDLPVSDSAKDRRILKSLTAVDGALQDYTGGADHVFLSNTAEATLDGGPQNSLLGHIRKKPKK